MTEIKPCPFCGQQPVMTTDDNPQVYCDILKYPGCPNPIADNLTEWQTRPIEDALTARIATLEAYVATQADELADWRNSQAAVMAETCNDKQHCACVPPMRRRIAELESAIAYTDGRNPVTVVVELQQRIRELEAIIIEASNAYNLPGAEPDTDVDIAAVALVRMCHEGRAALDDAACPYCELLAETQQRVRELEAAFIYPDGMRHDGPPQP